MVKTDYLIVGCGLYGAVLAERISNILRKKVVRDQSNTKGQKPYVKPEPEDGTEMKQSVAPVSLRSAIMEARTAKKWKQKDLASRMQVPVKTIADYETGKAKPNNAFIRRMELALGTTLPRATKPKK